jgi:ABC-type sugar transport system ATPase subunit
MNSRILILDEPTAALGLRESEVLLDQVRRLRAEGLTMILITHRIQDAIDISDKIVVLKGGVKQGELFPPSCSLEDVADMIVRGSA